ncbi:enoyl-CoA hydratase-related protein [Streptomyces carpinensis]|uniref:Enoyl-CoA hydratase-related protein n=1 Tax=Streptomyces carpinensis TaxID=66369 RepID=A0ABV1VWE4_9ACTN|nr:enoyl-CoA hydratase-related protein [Streptomyces carpinensis]
MKNDAVSGAEAVPCYSNIRIEDDGPISWIVLARPEKANALSNELLDEFSAALEWLRANGGKIIALRGDGRGFSAGYDLKQVAAPTAPDPMADQARLQRNIDRYLAMWNHPKPVIAAIHGYCIAGATQLATLADITIVTEDARIGEVTVPVGAGYVAPVWSTLVGPKRAKELAFVPGNSIDGRTAVEWGWANHAVPAPELLDRVRSLAERIAMIPADLLAIKKLSINRAMEAMGARSALAAVADADALAHQTPDVLGLRERIGREGLKAVIEAYRVEATMNLSCR